MKIYPVILSGGVGTRLWPLSREHYPKQFIALFGQQTLLQDTVSRLQGMPEVGDPLFTCNEIHRFLVSEQLHQMQITPAAIILEPIGKSTAPALTLAALWLAESRQDSIILAMPADHVIKNVAAFQQVIREAMPLAEENHLVTFGVVPTSPETSYGYIRKGEGYQLAAFVEKPNLETAEHYVASGQYLWNSGMFMTKASVWLEQIGQFEPEILRLCQEAYEGGQQDGLFYRVNAECFGACPSKSIDYAVMEKTTHGVVIPLAAEWSDVGSWSALHQVNEPNAAGNVLKGDVVAYDTENSLLESQSRLLAAVGLRDMIVVETADAVLVAHQNYAQEVKEIVTQLKTTDRTEHQMHRKVFRPWGYYEAIDAGEGFQVKRITVHPQQALSLQMHHHRSEHWVVVKGEAKVTRGEEQFMLATNQSTHIPIEMRHRLENLGSVDLEIIEVQLGSYLGEDDIVRFEDRYQRA